MFSRLFVLLLALIILQLVNFFAFRICGLRLSQRTVELSSWRRRLQFTIEHFDKNQVPVLFILPQYIRYVQR